MEKNVIKGNVKKYVCINTTSYNEDGNYCVQVVSITDIEELGFNLEDLYFSISKQKRRDYVNISEMEINDIVMGDSVGVFLMRIA